MGPAVTLLGALGAAAAAAGGAEDDSAELDDELSSLEELDTERAGGVMQMKTGSGAVAALRDSAPQRVRRAAASGGAAGSRARRR